MRLDSPSFRSLLSKRPLHYAFGVIVLMFIGKWTLSGVHSVGKWYTSGEFVHYHMDMTPPFYNNREYIIFTMKRSRCLRRLFSCAS